MGLFTLKDGIYHVTRAHYFPTNSDMLHGIFSVHFMW
jgi:hypothetical protein